MRLFIFFLICSTFCLSAQPFNSAYDEQAPVLSPDGNILFFTVSGHPENKLGRRDPGDIWAVIKTPTGWSLPQQQVQWNNEGYNSVIGFGENGNEVYLIGHYQSDGTPSGSQGISVSRKNALGWSHPEKIFIPYFTNKVLGSGSWLHPEANVLVYAAATPVSFGAEDIFVAMKNESGWNEPVRLSAVVNSQFQEWSPFLSEDLMTLYFSSNRPGGQGSFDVYETRRLDDTWQNWSIPVPVSRPVNSAGRELYFSIQSGQLIYTSTLNSDGYGDIRFLSLNDSLPKETPVISGQPPVTPSQSIMPVVPSGVFRLTGKVINQESGEPVPAKITITGRDRSIVQANESGQFLITISATENVILYAEYQGYIGKIEKIDKSKLVGDFQAVLSMQPASVGVVINLGSVLFRQSTAILLDESYDELNMVVDFMKTNPDIRIELSGHTDNRGDKSLNIKLSSERVKRVKSYLISKGIASKRIEGKGYGGSKPLDSNATEAGRKLNRRVEFKIIR